MQLRAPAEKGTYWKGCLRGSLKRSGRKARASGPQYSVSVCSVRMGTITSVPSLKRHGPASQSDATLRRAKGKSEGKG